MDFNSNPLFCVIIGFEQKCIECSFFPFGYVNAKVGQMQLMRPYNSIFIPLGNFFGPFFSQCCVKQNFHQMDSLARITGLLSILRGGLLFFQILKHRENFFDVKGRGMSIPCNFSPQQGRVYFISMRVQMGIFHVKEGSYIL